MALYAAHCASAGVVTTLVVSGTSRPDLSLQRAMKGGTSLSSQHWRREEPKPNKVKWLGGST